MNELADQQTNDLCIYSMLIEIYVVKTIMKYIFNVVAEALRQSNNSSFHIHRVNIATILSFGYMFIIVYSLNRRVCTMRMWLVRCSLTTYFSMPIKPSPERRSMDESHHVLMDSKSIATQWSHLIPNSLLFVWQLANLRRWIVLRWKCIRIYIPTWIDMKAIQLTAYSVAAAQQRPREIDRHAVQSNTFLIISMYRTYE